MNKSWLPNRPLSTRPARFESPVADAARLPSPRSGYRQASVALRLLATESLGDFRYVVSMPKKKKSASTRAAFRKNHQGRVRQDDLTVRFRRDRDDTVSDLESGQRLTGKGDLTRHRTVAGSRATPDDAAGLSVQMNVDSGRLRAGRVLSVHGLRSKVRGEDGTVIACATRQVLKSLSTDQRNVVVAGDRVWFTGDEQNDGMIHSVEPRGGVIRRGSRGRQHILVANVDLMLIIASVAQPGIKPALIDRFLLTAGACDLTPVLILNKCDLVDPAELQPLVGVYASIGVPTLWTSATAGIGIEPLRRLLAGRQTAVAGQSGVGKSSLLNAVDPSLNLAVGDVSADNDKGKHTTTAARMIPLGGDGGGNGAVFDTPGIRQFQLWDISAGEVAGLMPDLRPYVSHCRYPNCLHVAEDDCAVKDAVADGRIDVRRYDRYCHLIEDELNDH